MDTLPFHFLRQGHSRSSHHCKGDRVDSESRKARAGAQQAEGGDPSEQRAWPQRWRLLRFSHMGGKSAAPAPLWRWQRTRCENNPPGCGSASRLSEQPEEKPHACSRLVSAVPGHLSRGAGADRQEPAPATARGLVGLQLRKDARAFRFRPWRAARARPRCPGDRSGLFSNPGVSHRAPPQPAAPPRWYGPGR